MLGHFAGNDQRIQLDDRGNLVADLHIVADFYFAIVQEARKRGRYGGLFYVEGNDRPRRPCLFSKSESFGQLGFGLETAVRQILRSFVFEFPLSKDGLRFFQVRFTVPHFNSGDEIVLGNWRSPPTPDLDNSARCFRPQNHRSGWSRVSVYNGLANDNLGTLEVDLYPQEGLWASHRRFL